MDAAGIENYKPTMKNFKKRQIRPREFSSSPINNSITIESNFDLLNKTKNSRKYTQLSNIKKLIDKNKGNF